MWFAGQRDGPRANAEAMPAAAAPRSRSSAGRSASWSASSTTLRRPVGPYLEVVPRAARREAVACSASGGDACGEHARGRGGVRRHVGRAAPRSRQRVRPRRRSSVARARGGRRRSRRRASRRRIRRWARRVRRRRRGADRQRAPVLWTRRRRSSGRRCGWAPALSGVQSLALHRAAAVGVEQRAPAMVLWQPSPRAPRAPDVPTLIDYVQLIRKVRSVVKWKSPRCNKPVRRPKKKNAEGGPEGRGRRRPPVAAGGQHVMTS